MEVKNLVPWRWFRKDMDFNKDELYYLQRNMEQDMNRLFGNLLPKLFKENDKECLRAIPRVDISETDKEYTVITDLPGVQEKDIDVFVSKDNILTIKGKRETKEEEKERSYYRLERSYGSFERSVILPGDCNADEASSFFKNGTLTIKLPKKEMSDDKIKKVKLIKE